MDRDRVDRAYPDSKWEASHLQTKISSKSADWKMLKRVERVTTISGKSNIVYTENNYELSSLGTINDTIKVDDVEKGTLPSINGVLLTKSFAQSITSEETYASLVGESIKLFVNEMGEDNQPVTIEKGMSRIGNL